MPGLSRRPLLYIAVASFLAAGILVSAFLYRGTIRPRSVPARRETVAVEIARLRDLGQYQAALDLARKQKRELEDDRGASPWMKADAARLVTTLQHVVSLPDSSRQALAEADGDDAVIARTLMDADYRRGVLLANKQLETRCRLLGEDHLEVAISLAALGRLARAQGDFAHALVLQIRGLEIRRKALGDAHPEVATSLEFLGETEQVLARLKEAQRDLQESLAIRRELCGRSSPAVAASLNALADLFRRERQYNEAIAMFQDALQMRRRTLGARHPDVAETLCDLGLTYLWSGNWKKAAPCLDQAVKLCREAPGVNKEVLALSLRLESTILCKRGRYEEAERDLREDAGIYEAIRAQGRRGGPPSHALEVYAKLATTQLTLGKGEEAWASLERGLNRTLLDDVAPSGGNDSSTVPDPARAQGDPGTCSLATVQSALTGDAAIVGWLDEIHDNGGTLEYPIWGYVIRHAGPIQWARVDPPPGAGADATSRKVVEYRDALRSQVAWPIRAAVDDDLMQKAKAVYAERLAPLAKYLDGIDHLIVVRAMAMSYVPLDALVEPSGTWVADRYAITYTPSATLFAWMRKRGGPVKGPRGWRVLAIGDPGSGAFGRPTRATGSERIALDGDSPMRATREEVRDLAEVFPNSTILVGRDASKREIARQIVDGRLGQYDLIHFATHARIDWMFPIGSGLRLAQSTPPAGGGESGDSLQEESLLTASEIRATWKLKADLVTLSACETGESGNFMEPSSGLAGSLLSAGARSVLESLWDVDDRATCLLMGRFYENVTGTDRESRLGPIGRPMPKAKALQEAKHWLRRYRDSNGDTPFSSPAYWAAFILFGDSGAS